jgi:hypothetical protein
MRNQCENKKFGVAHKKISSDYFGYKCENASARLFISLALIVYYYR